MSRSKLRLDALARRVNRKAYNRPGVDKMFVHVVMQSCLEYWALRRAARP